MKQILVVVDMQKDFIDGSLGTREAQAIVPNAAERITAHEGPIFVTYDTHGTDYLSTSEGKKLPVEHCIKGTTGWQLDARIAKALEGKPFTAVEKPTFGSIRLPELVEAEAENELFKIELIGLCTDICVVSNALLLKAHFPETEIAVNASCCAGVSPETHLAALDTMRCCQIEVLGA